MTQESGIFCGDLRSNLYSSEAGGSRGAKKGKSGNVPRNVHNSEMPPFTPSCGDVE